MKKYLLLVLSLLGVSCSDKQTDFDGIEVGNALTLNYKEAQDKAFRYSELFEDFEIVPLDTTGGFLLSSPKCIHYEAGKIVVLDESSKVFIFDETGKGEAIIARKGQGANEYLSVRDMDISKDSTICLLTFPPKLMTFDFEGKFLNEVPMPFQGSYMSLMGDDKVAVFTDNLRTTEEQREPLLEILDVKGGSHQGYLPGFSFMPGNSIPAYQQRRVFTVTPQDELLCVHPLSNHVYSIAPDDVCVKYRIEFGGDNPHPEKINRTSFEDFSSFIEKEFPVYGFNSCWENNAWFHVGVKVNGKLTTLLYDKEQKNLYRGLMNDDLTNAMSYPIYATNDYLIAYLKADDLISQNDFMKLRGDTLRDMGRFHELLSYATCYENPMICKYRFK